MQTCFLGISLSVWMEGTQRADLNNYFVLSHLTLHRSPSVNHRATPLAKKLRRFSRDFSAILKYVARQIVYRLWYSHGCTTRSQWKWYSVTDTAGWSKHLQLRAERLKIWKQNAGLHLECWETLPSRRLRDWTALRERVLINIITGRRVKNKINNEPLPLSESRIRRLLTMKFSKVLSSYRCTK